MSKRFSPIWRMMMASFAVLALLLLGNQPIRGANSAMRIDESFGGFSGLHANVGVSLDNLASLRGFGGFDLLIAYDTSVLILEDAFPGSLPDSCGWEYFTYRSGAQGNCNGPCPSGFVRLVAIAETNNGDIHPTCFFPSTSGTLAWLVFRVTSDSIYLGTTTPISFYWLDCSDNTLASISGDTLYVSHKVYDFPAQNDIAGQPGYGGWQGISGSPDCLHPGSNQADTAIDFYNGGVHIVNATPIDYRGDLNLNGISNEVADLVIFSNYFMLGLDALPAVNRNLAIEASDVNADGYVLTYQDAVYLYRIIIGDTPPFPKQAVKANADAYFVQDPTNHSVAVNCDLPLAGAFMLIKGNVTPTYLIPQVGWGHYENYDGTYTRILIIGDPGTPYSNGVWFTYQGTGKLESVETTDWQNAFVTAHITNMATDCGDFDGSGSINVADIVYSIRYIFSGGFAPIDTHGGDANCDGSTNISDIVYVLEYIFHGGPAPCANCK
jgi:hypothetical protein